MLSTVVQINAGLSVHDRGAYNVALCSFVLTLLHFLWERLAERTVVSRSLLAAEMLAFVSFCWMMVQRDVYVGSGELCRRACIVSFWTNNALLQAREKR